jgi:DNA-binding SARP family transcriptional activator
VTTALLPGPRLELLGNILVTDADGVVRPELQSRVHRIALLGYLALAGAGRYRRRAEVLHAFWPHQRDDLARGALRQSVHHLRKVLGAATITSRGDDELGYVGWCDAVAFEAAVRSGQLEAALALYQGELLRGLAIDAEGFTTWLDDERRRLRTMAARAAWDLAGRAEASGALETALGWGHRAMNLDPTDEIGFRRLLALLQHSGNHAAAAAAYEEFADRLHAALRMVPSAATREAVAAMRRAGNDAADTGPAVAEPRRVMVRPLENRTGDAVFDSVGLMAADIVTNAVARLEGVSVTTQPTSAAGTIIGGGIYRVGTSLRVQLQVTDPDGRHLLPADAIQGAPDDMLDLLDALAERTSAGLAVHLETRWALARAVARPRTVAHYQSGVAGQDAFFRADWPRAIELFRPAAEASPPYPMAVIVSAIASWNLGEVADAATMLRRVDPAHTELGGFDRDVYEMVSHWLAGNWVGARDATTAQARVLPGSIAAYEVAEETRRLRQPREALSLLAALDLGHSELGASPFVAIEMARCLHLCGDHAQELEVAERALRAAPSDPAVLRLAVRARVAAHDQLRVEQAIEQRLLLPDPRGPSAGLLMREAALESAAHGQPADAAVWYDRAVAWYRSVPRPSERLQRSIARALHEAGRLDEAHAAFVALWDDTIRVGLTDEPHHPHLSGHLDAGHLAVLAHQMGDDARRDELTTRLAAADGPWLFGAQHRWLAALACLRGELAGASAHLRAAYAAGMPHDVGLHRDPYLSALRDTLDGPTP